MGPTTQEAARVKCIPAGTAQALDVLGWSITFLDTATDTGDALMLYELRGDSGTVIPPHCEENHEAFYVLDGEFELDADGETRRCGPGDFVCIQPMVPHSVRNVGPGWGRMLIFVSPGSQHQRFFEAVGTPLAAGADPAPLTAPPDFPRIAAAGRASGIHFDPPPGE